MSTANFVSVRMYVVNEELALSHMIEIVLLTGMLVNILKVSKETWFGKLNSIKSLTNSGEFGVSYYIGKVTSKQNQGQR